MERSPSGGRAQEGLARDPSGGRARQKDLRDPDAAQKPLCTTPTQKAWPEKPLRATPAQRSPLRQRWRPGLPRLAPESEKCGGPFCHMRELGSGISSRRNRMLCRNRCRSRTWCQVAFHTSHPGYTGVLRPTWLGLEKPTRGLPWLSYGLEGVLNAVWVKQIVPLPVWIQESVGSSNGRVEVKAPLIGGLWGVDRSKPEKGGTLGGWGGIRCTEAARPAATPWRGSGPRHFFGTP